jgi:hypothetical protein
MVPKSSSIGKLKGLTTEPQKLQEFLKSEAEKHFRRPGHSKFFTIGRAE